MSYSTLKILFIIIIFLGGLYFYIRYTSNPKMLEGLTTINGEIRCPNLLIQKGTKYYLYNSNLVQVPGVNPIEFNNLDGITVVESTPKHFGGKSTSTVDLLMFLFFNTTTKTKTNAEIFNKFTDKNEVSVRGEITIDGEDFVI